MSDLLCLCVVIVLVCFLALAVLIYSGLLSDISVLTGSPPIKKVTFAYKFKEGPYKNCGQLFKEAHTLGPKLSCIGMYYDDPKKVPGQQCRYAVGSILSEGENWAKEEILNCYEAAGFKIFSFPAVTHVVTTSFPCKTFFSILLAVRRVYPKLERYVKERKLCAHPFLEIYKEGQIYFMAPLARQSDFYVPEALQRESELSAQEETHSETEVSGADSNSDCSSGSGILQSDSRETSLAASAVLPVLIQDHGRRS